MHHFIFIKVKVVLEDTNQGEEIEAKTSSG